MTTDLTVIGGLSADEVDELASCEAVIERNLKGFVEAGTALTRVRDGRLYRDVYGTFEAYCETRWGLIRSRAYDYIDAAAAVAELSEISDTHPMPANEAQARAAGKAPAGTRVEAWKEVVATAPEGKITARHIEETIARRAGADTTPEEEATRAFLEEHRERQAAKDATPTLALGTAIAPAAPQPKPVRDGDEWYTPPEYAAAVRDVLGAIALDPASCEAANALIQADRFYTLERGEDGLALDLAAETVFCNPPYSNTGAWVAALVALQLEGRIGALVMLVNAKTETDWFGLFWQHAVLCFVDKRISFIPGDGGPSQTGRCGQAFAYLGPDPDRFCQRFAEFGPTGRLGLPGEVVPQETLGQCEHVHAGARSVRCTKTATHRLASGKVVCPGCEATSYRNERKAS